MNNQWYHLAFVCDGVKLTIYVNGNIDANLKEGRNEEYGDYCLKNGV